MQTFTTMLTDDYVLSEDLQYQLHRFFNSHNIALLNQHMRRQLVDYLDYELRTGVPLYFGEFLYPYNSLLDVLDEVAREINKHKGLHPQRAQRKVIIGAQEKVLAFLTATLLPEKIFLLHHDTAADSTEYFDLLVVVPSTSKTSFSDYESVISLCAVDHAHIDVSLHKSEVLQQQLQEGHVYFSLRCTKANLMYDDGKVALPEPDATVINTLREKAQQVFETASMKSESFLQTGIDCYETNSLAMAAFMLQQSIKLNVRGLIMALLGNCPRTHSFRDLKKQLKRCAPTLHYLISADAATEQRLLLLLEKAYLEARYTDNLVVPESYIVSLTEGSKRLLERTREMMEGLLSEYFNTFNLCSN